MNFWNEYYFVHGHIGFRIFLLGNCAGYLVFIIAHDWGCFIQGFDSREAEFILAVLYPVFIWNPKTYLGIFSFFTHPVMIIAYLINLF